MPATNTVVVGADGSPGSRTAVEYALQDAARRGAALRVVGVAQVAEYLPGFYGFVPLPSPGDVLEEMRAVVQQQLDEVRRTHPELAAVPATVEARIGVPGPELAEASEGAVLLVLGHRGRGAVRSVLVGSAGLYCVLNARCPVTIVRPATLDQQVPTAPVAAVGAVAR